MILKMVDKFFVSFISIALGFGWLSRQRSHFAWQILARRFHGTKFEETFLKLEDVFKDRKLEKGILRSYI